MEAYGALLLLSLLKIVVGEDDDISTISEWIVSPPKRCIPTAVQLGNCHVCVCKTDGVYHCRGMKCDMYKTHIGNEPSKPIRADFHSLPEIREGEPCFPDRLYKMDCNTCRCTKTQDLMCTKMACFNWKNLKPNESKGKPALRSRDDDDEKSHLPKVSTGMLCSPGKVYRSKCKRCYCSIYQKILCAKNPKDACTFDKFGNPPPIHKPEDIHPPIKYSDTENAISLSSASEQCDPGRYYKVDCNFCLCLDSGNLLCQKKLCLSYDDMNRLEAKAMSGKPCTPGEEIPSRDCKTCDCVNGKTLCTSVQDCSDRPQVMQLKGSAGPAEQLDPDTDRFKCIPQTVYKTDCNKCYCQDDGSLRCTQKTCLNFSQVKLLEEQREYLERHGL